MSKGRIEAFSDGVLAIIITIMVIELKAPHGDTFQDIAPLAPVALSYILSFLYVAIYWNNHHHLFHTVTHINGSILWANTHLLFWLSLIPFVTAWSGENHFSEGPMALYGFVLMMAGMAYFILAKILVAHQGKDSPLAKALGKDFKGKLSVVLYALATPLSFWVPYLSLFIYFLVAAIWIIPDSRIERSVRGGRDS